MISRARENLNMRTHGPAHECVQPCTRSPCIFCEGGLYVCSLCGAAEQEAFDRPCTVPQEDRINGKCAQNVKIRESR